MSIASPGIGSNLDINGIISSLMQVEQRPLLNLTTKEAGFQAKISALGTLKSALSQLQTGAKGLMPSGTTTAAEKYTTFSATVAKPEFATASAGAGAVPGSYNLQVVNVASSQKSISAAGNNWTSTGTTFASGKLTIEVGSFTGAWGPAVEIDLSDKNGGTGNYTLAEVRDKINEAKSGVTATLINVGGYSRLSLSGPGDGTEKAFRITETDAGVGGAGITPVSALTLASTAAGNYDTQAASDASAVIDGVPVTAKGNTLTNVIDGVTINLLKATSVGPPVETTKVTVSKDQTGALTGTLNAFIKGFNEFNTSVNSLTAYNSATKEAGALQGDSSARTAQSIIRGALNRTPPGLASDSTFQRLSDIGVQIQKDGSLKLDSGKLGKAIEKDFESVANLVAAYGKAFDTAAEGLVSSTGIMASREQGLQSSIKSITREREVLGRRLEGIETRYRRQFTELDQLMGSMLQTSSYLQQQLANLPKISA
jgi:flagellar hook-associated protein 2